MTNVPKPLDKNCIAKWVYTKEEWQYFARWHARNRGVLSYMWHFIFGNQGYVSSIEITGESVQIGKKCEVFKSPDMVIKRVDIDSKGKMNVMNITCQHSIGKELKEIRLPIPRGKLKEAIEVQEKLLGN